MITVTIKSNLPDLAATEKRLGDLSPAMRAAGEAIRGEALRNFREGGLWPSKWQPSQRVRKNGGQTLVDRGILRNSISVQDVTASSVVVGTADKRAALHQFGGDFQVGGRGQMILRGKFVGAKRALGKKNRKAVGMRIIGAHLVHMPARPFLPIDSAGNLSPAAMQRTTTILQNYIATGAAR